MSEPTFPILSGWSPQKHCRIPESSIPWRIIAPHEQQARINHRGQSLQRLFERGGLCHSEAIAVLEDRAWTSIPVDEAIPMLADLVKSLTDDTGSGAGASEGK
jgi:hypothetical protein